MHQIPVTKLGLFVTLHWGVTVRFGGRVYVKGVGGARGWLEGVAVGKIVAWHAALLWRSENNKDDYKKTYLGAMRIINELKAQTRDLLSSNGRLEIASNNR